MESNSAMMFAQRRREADGISLPVKARDMAGRFLARAARNKMLPLYDTPPMVTFTFDDVPASACETGTGILERHGSRGTFYVAGGGCGAASPVGRLASIEQIRTIWTKGHEIGCHTYSHPDVSRISLGELSGELDRNRSALQLSLIHIFPARSPSHGRKLVFELLGGRAAWRSRPREHDPRGGR